MAENGESLPVVNFWEESLKVRDSSAKTTILTAAAPSPPSYMTATETETWYQGKKNYGTDGTEAGVDMTNWYPHHRNVSDTERTWYGAHSNFSDTETWYAAHTPPTP